MLGFTGKYKTQIVEKQNQDSALNVIAVHLLDNTENYTLWTE